ncbi:MAG: cytochrome c maturation protein CcmE [Acidobacteriota bacterium]
MESKTKSKTLLNAFGVLMLVVFSSFAFVQFNDALTPYVSYEKAMASSRTVQVAGGLQPASSAYDETSGMLHFTLTDPEIEGKTLAVRYEGVKPANFEEAISIVAIGMWDEATQEFAAHDLLVKCPSKYQGVEGYDETKSYQSEGGYGADAESYGAERSTAEGYGAGGYGAEDSTNAAAGDSRAEGYGSSGPDTGAAEAPGSEFKPVTSSRTADDGG